MGKISTFATLGIIGAGAYVLFVNRDSIAGWLKGLGTLGAASAEAARTGGDVINVLTGMPVQSELYKAVENMGAQQGQMLRWFLEGNLQNAAAPVGQTSNDARQIMDAAGYYWDESSHGFIPKGYHKSPDNNSLVPDITQLANQVNPMTRSNGVYAPQPAPSMADVINSSITGKVGIVPNFVAGSQASPSAPASSASLNERIGGLTPNNTGTASTFNPALPAAVAWAQPGSPAWNAYYNK